MRLPRISTIGERFRVYSLWPTGIGFDGCIVVRTLSGRANVTLLRNHAISHSPSRYELCSQLSSLQMNSLSETSCPLKQVRPASSFDKNAKEPGRIRSQIPRSSSTLHFAHHLEDLQKSKPGHPSIEECDEPQEQPFKPPRLVTVIVARKLGRANSQKGNKPISQ
jgi:hypothetical protein